MHSGFFADGEIDALKHAHGIAHTVLVAEDAVHGVRRNTERKEHSMEHDADDAAPVLLAGSAFKGGKGRFPRRHVRSQLLGLPGLGFSRRKHRLVPAKYF
jgi:hypothetical protein